MSLFCTCNQDNEEGGEKKDDKIKKEVKKEGKEGKEGGSGKQGGAAPPPKDSRESEIIRNLKSEHKYVRRVFCFLFLCLCLTVTIQFFIYIFLWFKTFKVTHLIYFAVNWIPAFCFALECHSLFLGNDQLYKKIINVFIFFYLWIFLRCHLSRKEETSCGKD